MDTRLEILKSIEKAMELDKKVSFGQYVTYITSVDDLWYISDQEVKRLVDWDVKVQSGNSYVEIMPLRKKLEFYKKEWHDLTKEGEAEGYRRYKELNRGKISCQLEEKFCYYDFLCRFTDMYDSVYEEYKEWTIINHAIAFRDIIGYRYVPMYVCGWKDDKYTVLNTNSWKIPDAPELFEFIAEGTCLHYAPIVNGRQESLDIDADEWFALVLDYEGVCRVNCYATRVQFGMRVSPAKKEVELYPPDQAVEIFHELFGKCETIINN